MPTGYTAGVVDGEVTSLRVFALTCARAFGALVEFRDDPTDKIITEIPKPTYHAEQLTAARAEFKTFTSQTKKQKLAWAQAAIAERQKGARAYAEKDKLENQRLDAMIDKVEAWPVPTRGHVEYKNFMLQQLRTSLNDLRYCTESVKNADAAVAEDVIREQVAQLKRNIAYHSDAAKQELARWKERVAWIKAITSTLTE